MHSVYVDTVTIFNRYGDSKIGITWYPTVLHNVYLSTDRGANIAKTGLKDADTAKLFIKYKLADGNIIVSNKPYKRPKEWKNQAFETLPATLTFWDGADFFVRGEFSEDAINDMDYKKGYYDHINTNYDDVYLITTIGGPYKNIPHFEIGGK